MLGWPWKSRKRQGSIGGGGLAAAGWAEQEGWQARAGVLAGELARDRPKAKQSKVLLTEGPVVVAELQDELWDARRNGGLSNGKWGWV